MSLSSSAACADISIDVLWRKHHSVLSTLKCAPLHWVDVRGQMSLRSADMENKTKALLPPVSIQHMGSSKATASRTPGDVGMPRAGDVGISQALPQSWSLQHLLRLPPAEHRLCDAGIKQQRRHTSSAPPQQHCQERQDLSWESSTRSCSSCMD